MARKIKNYARYKLLSKGELDAQQILLKVKKKKLLKGMKTKVIHDIDSVL